MWCYQPVDGSNAVAMPSLPEIKRRRGSVIVWCSNLTASSHSDVVLLSQPAFVKVASCRNFQIGQPISFKLLLHTESSTTHGSISDIQLYTSCHFETIYSKCFMGQSPCPITCKTTLAWSFLILFHPFYVAERELYYWSFKGGNEYIWVWLDISHRNPAEITRTLEQH